MKRSYRPLLWLALLLIAALSLVACVRPVPGSQPTATSAATLPVVTIPVLPSPTPTSGEPLPGGENTPLPPVDGTEGAATPQPPTDSTPAVDPAATVTIPPPAATTDSSQVPQVQPTVPGVETTYTVVRGDNLFRIGLRFGCHYTILAQHNGISDPTLIFPGQVIRIPANC